MQIRCNYPSIIRNPDIYGHILNGFTDIYKNGKSLYRINHTDIQTILKGDYLRIKSLQINKGYILNEDSDNRHQPLLVQSKDIHKYNRDDYHKTYSLSYEESQQIHLANLS